MQVEVVIDHCVGAAISMHRQRANSLRRLFRGWGGAQWPTVGTGAPLTV